MSVLNLPFFDMCIPKNQCFIEILDIICSIAFLEVLVLYMHVDRPT